MLKAIFIFFFRQSDVFFHVNNEWPNSKNKKNWVHDGSTFGSERKHLDRKNWRLLVASNLPLGDP